MTLFSHFLDMRHRYKDWHRSSIEGERFVHGRRSHMLILSGIQTPWPILGGLCVMGNHGVRKKLATLISLCSLPAPRTEVAYTIQMTRTRHCAFWLAKSCIGDVAILSISNYNA